MIIRDAVLDDIPHILEMARRFAEYAEFWGDKPRSGVATDLESVAVLLETMIQNDASVLVVADVGGVAVGMIGGSVNPSIFNFNDKIASELFLWVDEEFRGSTGIKLIKAFEDQVLELGAKRIILTTPGKEEVSLGRLYGRLGYSHLETNYIKEF